MSDYNKERLYRKSYSAHDLLYYNVKYKQTDLLIGSLKKYYNIVYNSIKQFHYELEDYIRKDESFLHSLVPIDIDENAPYIAKRMAEAAKKANVGPMAGVAGAFSELIGHKILNHSDEVIIENGGDIFISTKKQRKIGIFAGENNKLNSLAIKIEPEKTPCGICTSSGKIGHSLSFGRCDTATIISGDTVLADAVATLAGNMLKCESDMESTAKKILSIKGVGGILFVINNKICVMGDVELARI